MGWEEEGEEEEEVVEEEEEVCVRVKCLGREWMECNSSDVCEGKTEIDVTVCVCPMSDFTNPE